METKNPDPGRRRDGDRPSRALEDQVHKLESKLFMLVALVMTETQLRRCIITHNVVAWQPAVLIVFSSLKHVGTDLFLR